MLSPRQQRGKNATPDEARELAIAKAVAKFRAEFRGAAGDDVYDIPPLCSACEKGNGRRLPVSGWNDCGGVSAFGHLTVVIVGFEGEAILCTDCIVKLQKAGAKVFYAEPDPPEGWRGR